VPVCVDDAGSLTQLRRNQAHRGFRQTDNVVQLPRVATPARGYENESEQRVAPAARQRILVADDNLDLGESMAMLLRFEGHEVWIANDGPSALDLAEESSRAQPCSTLGCKVERLRTRARPSRAPRRSTVAGFF
jgi:hypothetical protein